MARARKEVMSGAIPESAIMSSTLSASRVIASPLCARARVSRRARSRRGGRGGVREWAWGPNKPPAVTLQTPLPQFPVGLLCSHRRGAEGWGGAGGCLRSGGHHLKRGVERDGVGLDLRDAACPISTE